jgi:phosphoribosyl 1,2-cyclic phosphodiesterase
MSSIKKDEIKIKFWGVRGTVTSPGPHTVLFGGNTSCIELRFGSSNRLVIVDAGSGIRALGQNLIKNELPHKPIEAEIFITHTHWDHIMGFPYFEPIYVKGTKLKVYGPVTHEEDRPLDRIIGGQLSYRFFPVQHHELAAEIEYHQLPEDNLDLGDGLFLTTKYLNHPLLCLGYRFEYFNKSVCTGYDTEPFHNLFFNDTNSQEYDSVMVREGEKAALEQNQRISNFYQNADVLIHDAQYTQAEYEKTRKGWGHSSFESAIQAALDAKAKTVALFHHDPDRSDKELDNLQDHYRLKFGHGSNIRIVVAKEGAVLKI